MAAKSKIEWTGGTWNPIKARNTATYANGWFCTHVSEGCRNCYAEAFNARLGTGVDYKPAALKAGLVEVFLDLATLTEPLRWKKPRQIFIGSMTDLFGDFVSEPMLDLVFAIVALAQHHTFQVVTKRAARMRDYFSAPGQPGRVAALIDAMPHRLLPSLFNGNRVEALRHLASGNPLPNLWLGVSAEDQPTWEDRVGHLRRTPAAIRFVSAEPLLGPIDPRPELRSLDWIIVGGESGPAARPMALDWARQIERACSEAGVAFFFKQWGEYLPESQFDAQGFQWAPGRRGARVFWWREVAPDGPIPEGACSIRIGRRQAGRRLDGREHNAMPAPRAA